MRLIGYIPTKLLEEKGYDEACRIIREYVDELDVPEELGLQTCTITHEVPLDPVFMNDGRLYERAAIKKWYQDQVAKNLKPLSPYDRTTVLKDPDSQVCWYSQKRRLLQYLNKSIEKEFGGGLASHHKNRVK